MIDYEQFVHIKKLHDQLGLNAAQIARYLNLDARTVAKWLEMPRFKPRQPSPRTSKLDRFKPDIARMLDSFNYSAAQIWQRLRQMGFDGGYTIVKDYLRQTRPKPAKAFLTLAFAPGQCAQVDWGNYKQIDVGTTRRNLSFFVMVLAHSRMLYLEFTVMQTMEHFLACHQNAFAFFGGLVTTIMVDNLKSAVLERPLALPPVLNPRYAEFANHYGFTVKPCNVGKANEKGRVENAVGYVKKNFLAGLQLPDFAALNPAAEHWRDTVANVRLHGAVHKRPVDLFEQERRFLVPLPANPYDIATVKQMRASSQFRICLDTNRYSVPAKLAGQRLTVKTYPDRLCIYHGNDLVARHKRCYDRHQDIEDPDHPKPLLQQRLKARNQKLLGRFLALCPNASGYYEQLAQRRLNPDWHVRKIVALADIYGDDPVARAIDDALHFNAFSCQYIENICDQRSRFNPTAGPLLLTRNQDLLDIQLPAPDLAVYQGDIP